MNIVDTVVTSIHCASVTLHIRSPSSSLEYACGSLELRLSIYSIYRRKQMEMMMFSSPVPAWRTRREGCSEGEEERQRGADADVSG